MRSDNAAVSGSIADRFNFMSDCEQMQVRLINGKAVHQPKTKKKNEANMLHVGFESCG